MRRSRKQRRGVKGQTVSEMMLYISVIAIAMAAVGYFFIAPAYIDGMTKFNQGAEKTMNDGNTAGLDKR